MGRKSILLLALLHLWHVAVVVVNAEEERKEEQKLEQQPTMMLMLNTDMDFDLDDAGLSAGGGTYDEFQARKEERQKGVVVEGLPSNHPPVLDKDADCPTGATDLDPEARCKALIDDRLPDYEAGAACYKEQRRLIEDGENEIEATANAEAVEGNDSASAAAAVAPLSTMARLMIGESGCLFHLGKREAATELLEQVSNILPFIEGPNEEDEIKQLLASTKENAVAGTTQ